MKITVTEAARRAGEFFMGKSPVHLALERTARALDAMGIPFAIAGAMAVNAHGHVRTTEDVDILITPEGLAAFKARWLGRGWVERFPGSRGFQDAEHGVRIDVLLTGEYPGDGKPKPIAFPDPAAAAERGADGIPVIALRTLIELKLASGMTAPQRPRDLDDVIQLIRKNGLALDYAATLHPFVHEKFRELWSAAQIEDDY